MRKKVAAALITLLLLIATLSLLAAFSSRLQKPAPAAVNGYMDLSAWRFEEDGVIPLDGQWELYPDKLLSERDFAAGEERPKPEMTQVPGSWSKQMDTLGMATYRLRVQVRDTGEVYGLKTASIPASNRLIVNGRVVGSSGNPAEARQYEAFNRPYVSYFTLQPGWNEILLQAANYDFRANSGIVESIRLGKAGQIAELRDRATAHDWISVSVFLIMGLYFFGLYTQRRNDFSLAMFGIVCLCISLFISVSGERVLLHAAGWLPFRLYYRIQLTSAIGVGLGFFLYLNTAFRPYCFKWLVRCSVAIGAVLGVLNVGFGPELSGGLTRPLTSLFATFALLYATYVFILAALHRVAGSRYLAVAALALNVMALNLNMNFYFGVPIYAFPPVEPFLVLLMLALLMSLRFSNAFRKIEELSGELLEADKMKDDFLARTSHEFKTPLHGVMNISQSMLDNAASPPTADQRDKLQLITDITKRLSQLVYDILDLSRLKRGELGISPAPIDVRSVAGVQVQFYSYLCMGRSFALDNRVPADLPLALADESRLSQVIGNLLDNAIKHTESGSIVVTGEERGGRLAIAVQDSGKGIEPQDLPFIFEPFRSLESTQSRSFGLGLSIAKQLVELQGGTLTVASSPGAGSTFTFTLPIADRASAAVSAPSSAPPPPNARTAPFAAEYSFDTPHYANPDGERTVLVVDDQHVNLKVLLDALQPLDYRVIAVQNGYEALAEIERPGRLDLVILDLMMPGLSGYEVCREIRKRYSLLELPVLMVTAAIQPQEKVAAFQAGANDYLPKPFDLEELKARIGSLLAMKESLGRAVYLEVAFLQSQIKPHFLHNVLNSIAASSYTDADRARKMIVDLSDYLRGSFRFSNAEGRIAFAEEFQLIRTYVDIEQARFKDRIRFEYDIAEEAYTLRLPPLLLQPLVENAIRHGIGSRIEGGTVKLTAALSDGHWQLVVTDNGVGIAPERFKTLLDRADTKDPQGVGLLNINKRLKYEYGVALELASEQGRGTTITMRIPAQSA
ncbi:ATP-binding protein [Cohnella rhizosphaerae]|uniref:histidine kinase n=1 Tax=Cohnella rhizosphaerae TaxID=1457232 RepID=A0A9X4QTL5_9BACL|nr:ATP-binding protein [Cohnella rhizosphaerae]MDG0810539.1 ATP-binding protein [Cohnella rhizosphaerae]